MIQRIRSIGRGIGYSWVLILALLKPRTRQHVRGSIRLLEQGKQQLGSGDLPSLMSFLDARIRESTPVLDISTQLLLADAAAAFYAVPGLRYCMRRTILRYYALQGQQWEASFVVGVNRTDSTLAGHAWIEIEGVAFGEYDDLHEKMRVIYRHP